METPRFSAYQADLNAIRRSSAESAVNDNDCMLPLSYVRQFISRNITSVRKLCCGEIETYFWRSFRKFIGIGNESNTKAGSGQYINYYHKDTKWYGIRPFSPKQRHVITICCISHGMKNQRRPVGITTARPQLFCIRPLSCWWLLINWIESYWRGGFEQNDYSRWLQFQRKCWELDSYKHAHVGHVKIH